MEIITITGNLGRDAEVENRIGRESASFSVACNRKFYNAQNQEIKETNWYAVRYYNSGVVKYLTKGMKVTVVGHLTMNVVVKDGRTTVYRNVTAISLEMHGGGKAAEDVPFVEAEEVL